MCASTAASAWRRGEIKDPPYAQRGEGDRAEGVMEGFSDSEAGDGGEVGNPSTMLRMVPLPALRAGRVLGDYRPLNRGGRFSWKAVSPSSRSSLRTHSR
jgi:hypothetical protein